MVGLNRRLLILSDSSNEIFIGRQPILDRSQQLVAYELLFRRSHQRNSARVYDDLAATASVIMHAFADLGIEAALGPYKGFINCDEALLLSDLLEALPPDKIVIEVLETVDATPAIIERCSELKARGFTIALDDFIKVEAKFKPLLDLVEIVKVDALALAESDFSTVTKSLQKWPLKLLAEKVDSRKQALICHDLGYSLFQGYYFAKPSIVAGKKLGRSKLALVRLLGLVLDDAETAELEKVLKQEPGLTMNLIRLTNSAAAGMRTKVTSLRHAVTLLGRRQLQRWLQLLMYSDPDGSGNASPLMQLAATRGKLMELLAAKIKPGDQQSGDKAFMSGIMSLMPALMSVPMEEILSSLNLGNDVHEALASRCGSLGTMLKLTEALEGDEAGQTCHDLTAEFVGLDADAVNACLAEALTWASNIGRENQ